MTRLISWFTGLDTTGKAIMALVGVGLIVIGVATAFHLVDALTETAEQKGAVIERAATQGKVIENVKAANDARDAVNDPRSCAMYAECVRSARTPANCVRYLPDHEGCAVQSGASGGR
jgi:hypothetical protein